MINIYHASHHALVADEHLKVFYYMPKESAKLAQGVKCTMYESHNLGKIQEYYEKKGYEEVRM